MSEDINQQILDEIRKSRRSNQVLLVVAVVVLILCTVTNRSNPRNPPHSWDTVRTAMRELDYPRALSLAQANVLLLPNDYYGHGYLGAIYLAMGNLTNSEAEYQRAYELFPSEENEKDLAAIRKRIAATQLTLPPPK